MAVEPKPEPARSDYQERQLKWSVAVAEAVKAKRAEIKPKYRIELQTNGRWVPQSVSFVDLSMPPLYSGGEGIVWVHNAYNTFNTLTFNTRDEADRWMQQYIEDEEAGPIYYGTEIE